MICPKYFVDNLIERDISFFAGVPDSLLKNFCAYLAKNINSESNIITANEGGAVGLAAGYHLATGKIPLVYMQNSGIGNAVNPLLSLIDKEVYNIPLIMLIGWRGEPGTKDEPQHIKQGKVTLPLLDSMGIKNSIFSSEESILNTQLDSALEYIKKTNAPYAFIVRKDTFKDYKLLETKIYPFDISRESAIHKIISLLNPFDIVVATTGMISREVFEYRELIKNGHSNDFLTVGAMGHASQIALGIALEQKHRKIYCFDGDGAVLMHMGGLAIIGAINPKNFVHIVFNNGAHDSVGGQPTVAFDIDIPKIALACGYSKAISINSYRKLSESFKDISEAFGPIMLEIKVKKGSRKDLGRPTTTPLQNKEALMRLIQK